MIRVQLLAIALLTLCPSTPGHAEPGAAPPDADFIYHAEKHLLRVKAAIAAGNPYFVGHRAAVLAQGDALLKKAADPVVNKTVIPPSGDLHDYISYAPYRWPDQSKKDGLPWKAIDGVVNPVSRGSDTDYVRLREFSTAIENLSFAYYFSGDTRYADKALELLSTWLVDPRTRVHPNINYGQGVRGWPKADRRNSSSGRVFPT